MTMLKASPQISLPLTVLALTQFAGGSPAKTFRPLEWGEDWGQSDPASGPSSCALLARYDPASRSWKTCQPLLPVHEMRPEDGLVVFSETWPRSGMMRSGIAFRLPTLARAIRGTGYGLWQSPLTAYDGRSETAFLAAKARADAKRKAGLYKKGCGSPGMVDLRRAVLRSERALREIPSDADLNPRWVEQLIGFPDGWLNIEPSETP